MSMGESVNIEIYPQYSEAGEPLEYGRVNVEGFYQTLFSEFGYIPELFAEFTEMIKEAKEMLPQYSEMTKEAKVEQINALLAEFEREGW